MSAEPFDSKVKVDNLKKFADLLHELLKDNKSISKILASDWDTQKQITDSMSKAITEPLKNKKKLYLKDRIENQRDWYSRNAKQNKSSSQTYILIICFVYILAIGLLFIRVYDSSLNQVPIETLAVIVSSLIGWTQLKRFNDLASSYKLTAYELGIIKSRFNNITTLTGFSEFVSDAESAFSREHTQWAARRDH